jgi:hypothetical protein
MIDISTTDLAELKRDTSIRGYDDPDIENLVTTPAGCGGPSVP